MPCYEMSEHMAQGMSARQGVCAKEDLPQPSLNSPMLSHNAAQRTERGAVTAPASHGAQRRREASPTCLKL